MVGYALLAKPQRDLLPEEAAAPTSCGRDLTACWRLTDRLAVSVWGGRIVP
jgi:hypothetical protein